ncbi:hypothetical protein D046_8460A, partial [Vibrio parahaemolyticus V-223/04]
MPLPILARELLLFALFVRLLLAVFRVNLLPSIHPQS